MKVKHPEIYLLLLTNKGISGKGVDKGKLQALAEQGLIKWYPSSKIVPPFTGAWKAVRWPQSKRSQLLAYRRTGATLRVLDARLVEVLDPSTGCVVQVGFERTNQMRLEQDEGCPICGSKYRKNGIATGGGQRFVCYEQGHHWTVDKLAPGRKPIGDRAMTGAERVAQYRKRKSGQ